MLQLQANSVDPSIGGAGLISTEFSASRFHLHNTNTPKSPENTKEPSRFCTCYLRHSRSQGKQLTFIILIRLYNWNRCEGAGMEGCSTARLRNIGHNINTAKPQRLESSISRSRCAAAARFRRRTILRLAFPRALSVCCVVSVSSAQHIIQRAHSLRKRKPAAQKRPWHHRRDRDPSIPSPASLEISNRPYRSSFCCSFTFIALPSPYAQYLKAPADCLDVILESISKAYCGYFQSFEEIQYHQHYKQLYQSIPEYS